MGAVGQEVGMKALWIWTGVTFVVSGALQLLFFVFTIVGIGMGGVLAFGAAPFNEPGMEEMGSLLLGMYILWFFCTLIAGSIHLVGGIHVLMGKRNPILIWTAVGVTVLSLATVYCALPALVGSILGALAMLLPMADDVESEVIIPPTAPAEPVKLKPAEGPARPFDPPREQI